MGLRPFGPLPLWLLGPLIAAIQRRPKIERAAIEASADGLRIGDALVPRARLASALLRHEHEKAYVVLGRKGFLRAASVDIQVESEDQADELCRALGLDAASTTAEFKLFRDDEATRKTALVAIAAAAGVMVAVTRAHLGALAPLLMVGLLFLVVVPVLILSRQVKLRVGADGIALREGLTGRRFVSHDEIRSVSADGVAITIELEHGSPIRLNLASGKRRRRRTDRTAEVERQAQSIVWRIEKAREAYRALAGDAPQAALALDRGEKTLREWIDQLRAIGVGANATFRSAQLTREQLLRIVESTTAAARERIAAAVALREALTDEEKPRIRVAADRCAEPALGEAMVRVALAPSDEELESALEEASALSAVGESR